jgi:tRNA 2-selenouridine synthase
MPSSLPVDEFLAAPGPILDVRSPGEYAQGHIPGAISFPLFTNEERAEVGTCYKQQGRDEAVELGFAIAGPKSAEFIACAKALMQELGDGESRLLRLHCWRGGMRSEAVAWVLRMAGFQVVTLKGGYKFFRRWVLETFAVPRPILILGGMTGTGKTDILHELAAQGEQVLDLEAIAHHRGSSFGSLGLPPQPTNEQFENEIAVQWIALSDQRPVWIEAESKRIGLCRIPEALFDQMERSPVIEAIRSREERIQLLVEIYGRLELSSLIEATERIRKRLGGLRTQQAVDFLQNRQLAEAVDLILAYYDKTYDYDLKRRSVRFYPVEITGLDAIAAASRLIQTDAPHADQSPFATTARRERTPLVVSSQQEG